jgi:hypothetical protein
MRPGAVLLAVLAALLLAAPAADAAKRPIVGIGDQKISMFEDPRFKWLGLRHARLVVPWYVAVGAENKRERSYVDEWMNSARRAKVSPVVGFGHGFAGKMRTYLPKRTEFRRAAAAFRKRYPWVRTYIAWNEANHCSQPTCKRPERAAQYFDALRSVCRRCTVVAPAVLDQPNMVRWLARFRKAARSKPRIYALHNYLDVNRLRSRGTRRLLRAIPRSAKVWVAETGGVVARTHFRKKADFPENPTRAGKVTTYALELGRKHPQITRVYLYHWNIHKYDASWDSGLIDQLGKARPGFDALARFRGKDPAKAPKPPPPPPPRDDSPIAENRPPAENQGPSGGNGQPDNEAQQPPPQEPPPPPSCGLPVCLPTPVLGLLR